MKKNNYYYDIGEAIDSHPDDIIFIAIGGRNTGKTYSALCHMIDHNARFVFVKRTIEDVNILCAGSGKITNKPREYAVDLSPFVAINRDRGTNIKAFSVIPGLGAFYPCGADGAPSGEAIGYIVALSAVNKVKGFDLSICDFIIFDEFIPQNFERVNRKEGDALMQLYKTVARDREHRGREALKLVMLANAESISNPVFNTLELTDTVTEMQIQGRYKYEDLKRGIYIERVRSSAAFEEVEQKSKIYAAMDGTQWAKMALNNEFSYDDFTAVKKIDLRRYGVYAQFKYRHKLYYIYNNGTQYYLSRRRNGKAATTDNYNLDRQTEQERFYYDIVIPLRSDSIDGRVLYESYSLYDLIMNYKKFYKIGA